MGMQLGVRVEDEYEYSEDQRWIGSKHGHDTAESITLDGDAFIADPDFANGMVPAGVVVAKRTSDGLYVPYDNASGVAGVAVAAGHLLTDTRLRRSDANNPASPVGKVGGALLWHGQVVRNFLPTGHGLDAAAEADLRLIHYVG